MSDEFGLIGLGHVGGNLWRRFADTGTPPVAHDIDADVMERFRGLGARTESSPADVARAVDTVVLSLPTSVEAEPCLLGVGGVASAMAAGGLVIDMTSGRPPVSRRLAAALAERDIGYVDCGVSGGSLGAAAGTLMVMLGGDDADVDRAMPVLERIATRFYRCGPVGAGHTMKTVHNMSHLVMYLVQLEAFAIGAAAGLDPRMVGEVSGHDMWNEYLFGPDSPRDIGFSIAMYAKDLEIAAVEAGEHGVPLPVSGSAQQLMRALLTDVGPTADMVELAAVFERWTGVRISGDPARVDKPS